MARITKKDRLPALYEAIAGLSTMEECQRFFEDLCTTTELSALEQRFAVADLLKQDMVYQEILNRTSASTSTISRVKRVLTDGSGALSDAIDRVRDHSKTEEQI